jgi:septation ring formation regulator EzrA
MNINKSELKQLIHEVLSEVEFNPLKQKLAKSDATAAANALAQAEFDKLDALKKGKKIAASGSVVASDDYKTDYEKRMKNLIIRRDMFEKKLTEIDAQLNVLGSEMSKMKNANDQLNFLKSRMQPLMNEKGNVLSDLKDIYQGINESWAEISKKYSATLATLKSK